MFTFFMNINIKQRKVSAVHSTARQNADINAKLNNKRKQELRDGFFAPDNRNFRMKAYLCEQ